MLSTHRSTTRLAGLLVGASFLFVACSGTGGGPSAGASAGSMDALVAQAKKEGNLTTIALPHTWCNYGEMLTAFSTKYGIKINELNPDGSSAAEIDAIKANKTNPGPQAPDVVDVGLSFGPQAKTDGVLANYKVATWNDIPAAAKDADGAWYGDYYGVMSIETNTKVVPNAPKSYQDLLKPEYKGKVALSGDPTKSNQAISAVWGAALANGGSIDNVQPGLDFFKKLNDMGNFVPVIAKQATVASGETPIVLTWTYTALADRDKLAGNPAVEVNVPTDAKFAGMYVQGISAYAPHPFAARLWEEFLYSNEGQLIWLKGYCNPIRYDALVAGKLIPADLAAKLPDSVGAQLPTLDQITAASKAITTGWPTTVGVTVK